MHGTIDIKYFPMLSLVFQAASSYRNSKTTTSQLSHTCFVSMYVISSLLYVKINLWLINRLTHNDPYMGRTAPLTSKRCILYIYSTNIGTEYFKPALYSFFSLSSKCSLFHNGNLFGSCIIHILYTGCAKIKK